jgi:hypothetical protein
VSCLFSEWISCNDESMSSTTVAVPVVTDERRHTRARTLPTASHTPARIAGSIWRNVRYSVESDGTDPNRSDWQRRRSMSAHALPPPASINIAWTSTLPRS